MSPLQGWHPESEFRELLDKVRDAFERGPNLERRLLMAISQQVQDQVDATKALTDIVGSVDKGLKALQTQVADLQTKVDAAPSLSPEDKAALTQSVADTNAVIETLKSDIPANTATPAAAPSTPA